MTACEDELGRTEVRPWRGRRDVRQNKGQNRERRQHGQCCTRATELKPLFVMTGAAPQQAESDDPVADNHHSGEHRVAGQRRLSRRNCNHDGNDQRHLDYGHRDRQHERAKRLARAMGDHLGVVHGRENRGDQGCTGNCRNEPTDLQERRQQQNEPSSGRPRPGPPRYPHRARATSTGWSSAHYSAASFASFGAPLQIRGGPRISPWQP